MREAGRHADMSGTITGEELDTSAYREFSYAYVMLMYTNIYTLHFLTCILLVILT